MLMPLKFVLIVQKLQKPVEQSPQYLKPKQEHQVFQDQQKPPYEQQSQSNLQQQQKLQQPPQQQQQTQSELSYASQQKTSVEKKKKKKEKHKNKDKEKSKSREERKKHKKDKDRQKEKSKTHHGNRSSNESTKNDSHNSTEPIKITIAKDKIQSDHGKIGIY